MRVKAIACEVFHRELCLLAAHSRNVVDIAFKHFGLHSSPEQLRAAIQSEIDDTDPRVHDCIVLAYGLCSRGTAELIARDVPVVIPRAHDCITHLLGSNERYIQEFRGQPGTYYYSPGWIERKEANVDQGMLVSVQETAREERFLEYVQKYGEDNAQFLMEQETQWMVNYTRAVFIDTGVGDGEVYRRFTRDVARSHDWEYSETKGDLDLLGRLVEGDWNDDDYLIARPGETIMDSGDARIVKSVGSHDFSKRSVGNG